MFFHGILIFFFFFAFVLFGVFFPFKCQEVQKLRASRHRNASALYLADSKTDM